MSIPNLNAYIPVVTELDRGIARSFFAVFDGRECCVQKQVQRWKYAKRRLPRSRKSQFFTRLSKIGPIGTIFVALLKKISSIYNIWKERV